MISEKNLEIERDNRNRIYLHKERLFWVAYERSAYLFVNNVRAYQVQKRNVKELKTNVVSVAFPDAALKNVELPIVKQTDSQIVLKVVGRFDESRFDEWRAGVPMFEKRRRGRYVSTTPGFGEVLLRRLTDFDVTSSTPIDCMNFIVDMKRQFA